MIALLSQALNIFLTNCIFPHVDIHCRGNEHRRFGSHDHRGEHVIARPFRRFDPFLERQFHGCREIDLLRAADVRDLDNRGFYTKFLHRCLGQFLHLKTICATRTKYFDFHHIILLICRF